MSHGQPPDQPRYLNCSNSCSDWRETFLPISLVVENEFVSTYCLSTVYIGMLTSCLEVALEWNESADENDDEKEGQGREKGIDR